MATILHKRSATTAATPAAGSLSLGELALNTTDGKLFTKKGDGTVVEIGPAGSYTLPVATDFSLGGIKKGVGLAIDGNGFLTPDATVVATLTGTQTLSNKTISSGQITGLATSATTDATNANNINSGTLANARLGVSNTTLTYAASVTWASDYLKVATITLAGACTLTITGLTAGGTYNLIVKQDATGSRIVTWVTTVKWSAGAAPTLSTAANSTDIVSFIYDGTTLFGTALKGFA